MLSNTDTAAADRAAKTNATIKVFMAFLYQNTSQFHFMGLRIGQIKPSIAALVPHILVRLRKCALQEMVRRVVA